MKNPDIQVENEIKALGTRIKSARLAKNITMQTLADTAGVSRHTLSSIERGSGKQRLIDYVSVVKSLGFLSDIQSVVSMEQVAKIINSKPLMRIRARQSISKGNAND